MVHFTILIIIYYFRLPNSNFEFANYSCNTTTSDNVRSLYENNQIELNNGSKNPNISYPFTVVMSVYFSKQGRMV